MSGFLRAGRSVGFSKSEQSSGIASLDRIFKPGFGTITAFYEDENSTVHDTLLQALTSHAVSLSPEKTFVCSEDRNKLVYFSPKDFSANQDDVAAKAVIAWRYKDLGVGREPPNWNISKKIPLKEENTVALTDMMRLLEKKEGYTVVIFSLYSPLHNFSNETDKLLNLFKLKKLARTKKHTIFLSIPVFLHEFDPLPFFDNVFVITAQLMMIWEESRYACMIEIKKLTTVGKLRVNSLDSLKYGVRISSKGIFIESVDIPPEEEVDVPGPCLC